MGILKIEWRRRLWGSRVIFLDRQYFPHPCSLPSPPTNIRVPRCYPRGGRSMWIRHISTSECSVAAFVVLASYCWPVCLYWTGCSSWWSRMVLSSTQDSGSHATMSCAGPTHPSHLVSATKLNATAPNSSRAFCHIGFHLSSSKIFRPSRFQVQDGSLPTCKYSHPFLWCPQCTLSLSPSYPRVFSFPNYERNFSLLSRKNSFVIYKLILWNNVICMTMWLAELEKKWLTIAER